MDFEHELWLGRNRPAPSDLAEFRRKAAKASYRPSFLVILVAREGARAAIDVTIASLKAQVYERHELKLADGAAAANQELWKTTADYVILLEPGDALEPEALAAFCLALRDPSHADAVYCDHDEVSPAGIRHAPFFKPAWSPELFLSKDYIGRACAVKASSARDAGGFRAAFEGAVLYDLLLRMMDQGASILRLPSLLASLKPTLPGLTDWRRGAGLRAVQDSLRRRGVAGEASLVEGGGHRVRYRVTGDPLISIVIPIRDKIHLLHACLESIRKHTKRLRHEIVIVDNRSEDPFTRDYLLGLGAGYSVLDYEGEFHFPRINNWAAGQCRGDLLVFLNNDTEVRDPDWLEELAGLAQREGVGAVGPRLLDASGRIQQQGWVYWNGGLMAPFQGLRPGDDAYFNISNLTRDCTVLSAACLMVSRPLFERLGGFDERYRVAYSDLDLCLRLARRGYRLVCSPHAAVTHHGAVTRGPKFHKDDWLVLRKRWERVCTECDPTFNPNLGMESPRMLPRPDVSPRREARGTQKSWRPSLLDGVPVLRALDAAAPEGGAAEIVCELALVPSRVWRRDARLGGALLSLPLAAWLAAQPGLPWPARAAACAAWIAAAFWIAAAALEDALWKHLDAHVTEAPEAYRLLDPKKGCFEFSWPCGTGLEASEARIRCRRAGYLHSRGAARALPWVLVIPAVLSAALLLVPAMRALFGLEMRIVAEIAIFFACRAAWAALILRRARAELRLPPAGGGSPPVSREPAGPSAADAVATRG